MAGRPQYERACEILANILIPATTAPTVVAETIVPCRSRLIQTRYRHPSLWRSPWLALCTARYYVINASILFT